MDYVPKMISLTDAEKKVRLDYESRLDDWHSSGRPPKGLYSYKLEFGTEVLRETPPTVIESSETYEDRSGYREEIEEATTESLRNRRAIDMTAVDSDFFEPVLWSEGVTVWAVNGNLGSTENWRAYRHGNCHELLFVHRAEDTFSILTDFGLLEDVRQGDFVYLPRGTTYAFQETGEVSVIAYEVPERLYRPYDYWMGEGQPWPFPPDATIPPEPVNRETMMGDREPIHDVVVKQRTGDYTRLSYKTPVFDVAAWEGNVWPFVLHMDDLNALTSPDFHLDPPKVTVFAGESEDMYLQVFLPRWMQSPPYNHMNRVDEALLNHSGYEARPEIGDGYLTLHPAGVPHGPDPRVVEEVAEEGHPEGPEDIPWANEIGVMVESTSPFAVLEAGRNAEVSGYDQSWSDVASEEELYE